MKLKSETHSVNQRLHCLDEISTRICFLSIKGDACFQPASPISEYHVFFEDQWMVASLCDECLTTLCGLILG
jgi:hypothetical protein